MSAPVAGGVNVVAAGALAGAGVSMNVMRVRKGVARQHVRLRGAPFSDYTNLQSTK